MFINPFEERDFGARFAAVFSFAKQNFFSVLKFYFPIFLLLSFGLYFCFVSKLNTNVDWAGAFVMLVNWTYMYLYTKYNGNVGSLSYKECYESFGRSFLISIEAGFFSFLYFLLPIIIIIVTFAFCIYFGMPKILSIVLFVAIFMVVLCLIQLYQIHYFFSYKEYKGVFKLFKELFGMLKGCWLSTLLYISVFNVMFLLLLCLVCIPFFVCYPNADLPAIVLYLISPLLIFFLPDNAIIFQYGHLRALWNKKQLVESEQV